MEPNRAPVALDDATVDALTTVRAWCRAFDTRDVDALVSLACPEIRLHGPRGVHEGHEALRETVERQRYGIAQHIRPLRYLARLATVVVQAVVELRWAENGELAESTEGFGVFSVRDGQILEFSPEPDLEAAWRAAGWAPSSMTDLAGGTT